MATTQRRASGRTPRSRDVEPEADDLDDLDRDPEDGTDEGDDSLLREPSAGGVDDDDLDLDIDDDDDDDLIDDAQSGFVEQKQLLGRLLLIYPTDKGTRESTRPGQQGKMYEYIVTTTHVLTGKPDGNIEEIPWVLEDFQFTGVRLVGQLRPKLRTPGRAVRGVLRRVEAKRSGDNQAWELAPANDKMKEIARQYARALKAKRRESNWDD